MKGLDFANIWEGATKYMPEFSISEGGKADSIFLIVDGENFAKEVAEFDKQTGLNITKAMANSGFKAKFGEIFSTFTFNDEMNRVFVISAGKDSAKLSTKMAQEIGAKISSCLNCAKSENVILGLGTEGENSVQIMADICYGIMLRNYRFDRYFHAKKEGKNAILKKVGIYFEKDAKSLEAKITELRGVAEHVLMARELVNMPAGDINPQSFADIIEGGFKKTKVKTEVLGVKEMQKLGMNSLLAVGVGSEVEPKTVIMEYMGNPESKDVDIAIVGKGVCFDSGGLSLKPAGSMEDMKIDKAASVVTFATLSLIAKMGLKVNVVGVVGLVENMPDGKAYKPGDVLKSMSGQTIEVLNTDAEGRLVLADCLYHTQKHYKPKYMIDLATLTGAVTVALADVYAGLMFNDDEIAAMIEEAGKLTSDTSWRLPFGPEYDSMINSSIADMKNIGSARGAGTITAGQFLKRFVNCEEGWNTKWAHLDIAGVAYDGKGGADPKVAKGATGWGVFMLYTLIKNTLSK